MCVLISRIKDIPHEVDVVVESSKDCVPCAMPKEAATLKIWGVWILLKPKLTQFRPPVSTPICSVADQ